MKSVSQLSTHRKGPAATKDLDKMQRVLSTNMSKDGGKIKYGGNTKGNWALALDGRRSKVGTPTW